MPPQRLILASSSPYRRALLERLGLPFEVSVPAVDEAMGPGETAEAAVERLARAKARAVASRAAGDGPPALVIGSDQLAAVDDLVLGKPGNRESNVAQLLRLSGRLVRFPTALCLVETATGAEQCVVETFRVRFRALARAEVERYVDREQPYDCAGGFRAEGYGIALFESLEGADPNTLIGLPLIALCTLLRARGFALP